MTVSLTYQDNPPVRPHIAGQVTRLGLESNGTVRVERRSGSSQTWVEVADDVALTNSDGLRLSGNAGDYASAPDAAALDITGDIDIRVDATLDEWATGDFVALTSKWVSPSSRSYALYITPTGNLRMAWSTDGTVGGSESADSTVVATPGTGDRLAVRGTLDVDNGSSGYTVTFYTAPSIAGPWAQLGDPVDNAGGGITSIFVSTVALAVGSDTMGTANFASGLIHAAEVYNGIDGTVVASPNFAAQSTGATSFDDDQGNTWTVQGDAEVVGGTWLSFTDFDFIYNVVQWYRFIRTDPPVGLFLVGSAGDYASTPDKAALDITGDIDLRADVTADNWFSGDQGLVAKFESDANERSYYFRISGDGTLTLFWSTDGTVANELSVMSTQSVPVTEDGQRLAVRVTLRVNDGSGNHIARFFTAPTITDSWTQLGSAVTTAGTTSIHSGTAVLEVGGFNAASDHSQRFAGTIHAVEVHDGVDGALAADPVFENQVAGTTSFSDDAGNVWTLQGDARIVAEVTDGPRSIETMLSVLCSLWDLHYYEGTGAEVVP